MSYHPILPCQHPSIFLPPSNVRDFFRGMAMGPMALGDLVGQELFWKQRKVGWEKNKSMSNGARWALRIQKKNWVEIYMQKKR